MKMTDCWATAIHAIDELENARTAQGAWHTLATVAAAHGFTSVAAFAVDGGDAAPALYANLPFDRLEALRQALTPVAAAAFDARHSLCSADASSLSVEQRKFVAAATKVLGGGEALLSAVAAGGRKGFVVLAGREPLMLPIVRSSLHLLAELCFAHAIALESKALRRDQSVLSPRETECLRLSARGKTDGEIGRTLGISPRTARFHIENVKKKLGVATRVQAVAEALRLKAIAA
jgi:DNA-binding CsgD family transcriptional regulator